MITYSINERTNIHSSRKPMMKHSHISDKVTQSLFYRSLYLYNLLEFDIKCFNPKKLSKYLQSNIIYIFPNNEIPKVENQ